MGLYQLTTGSWTRYLEDSIFYLYSSWSSPRGLYKVTVEREVGGPGPGTWKTVSLTFIPSSWSSRRGLYQVTMEKTLEVLCLGTWKTVSSTFTPSSWSSRKGLYQVTMEKKLEVLDHIPGRQYLLPLAFPETSTR